MCGLSGLVVSEKFSREASGLKRDVEKLLLLSHVRGQDSAGAAFLAGNQTWTVKEPGSVRHLVKGEVFRNILSEALKENSLSFAFIGQSRLATSGHLTDNSNNQPVFSKSTILVHNGIVTEIEGESTVGENSSYSDTVKVLEYLENKTGDAMSVLQNFFGKMRGSATFAILKPAEKRMLLATNTGSLYYFHVPGKFFGFTSEQLLTKKFLENCSFSGSGDLQIVQLKPGHALDLKIDECELSYFRLKNYIPTPAVAAQKKNSPPKEIKAIPVLKRCSKCILPHTYPMIEFDSSGVCNFCRRYNRQVVRGDQALEEILSAVRSKDGSPDCLFGLSGGRDSSYGLHLLKTKYGMNPIAYTFDWGLTTEVSRRNQARLCGQLGVEHIIRSADLAKKRRNIKNNVEAFLKRPHLGMVPLFMAGDKEFYQLGRTLRDTNNLPLTIMGTGQALEQREFMTGFCGVDENIANNKRFYNFALLSKIRLSSFYVSQYIKNPAYLNSSFADSVKSFFYSFVYKDNFLSLYEYVPWQEQLMEETLIGTYAWEPDQNYGSNQWRMGDGQTAFTNYIFFTVAGFSEYDNFRSNQIREGLLSRQEALRLVEYDNQPKMEMLKYFAETVGIDLESVMKQIEKIPKLY